MLRAHTHTHTCPAQISGMVYDQEPEQGRRIYLFGGQGDTDGHVLLNDLHTLDVSSADIRPRPRITGVRPSSAVLTGECSEGRRIQKVSCRENKAFVTNVETIGRWEGGKGGGVTALERLRCDWLRLERLRRMSLETGEVKGYVFTPRG